MQWNLFLRKDGRVSFWRIFGAIIAACVVVFTGTMCYLAWKEDLRQDDYYAMKHEEERLSQRIWYHKGDYKGHGYVYNFETGEHTLEQVDQVVKPRTEGEWLAAFRQKERYGYLDVNTGREVLPARYWKAWNFSGGLAAVVKKDSVLFIDRKGAQAFGQQFRISNRQGLYVFQGAYCQAMNSDGKVGLIDKTGHWALPPDYDWLVSEGKGYWSAQRNGKWGVYSDSLTLILPFKFRSTTVAEEEGIYVSLQDYSQQRYDYAGNLVDEFICNSTNPLYYEVGGYDDEGEPLTEEADCMMYSVDLDHYGLMGKDGKPITPPLYTNINAIGKDLYRCAYDEYDTYSVLLNGKGQKVNP